MFVMDLHMKIKVRNPGILLFLPWKWKMGSWKWKMGSWSYKWAVFHFHDYGRKGRVQKHIRV